MPYELQVMAFKTSGWKKKLQASGLKRWRTLAVFFFFYLNPTSGSIYSNSLMTFFLKKLLLSIIDVSFGSKDQIIGKYLIHLSRKQERKQYRDRRQQQESKYYSVKPSVLQCKMEGKKRKTKGRKTKYFPSLLSAASYVDVAPVKIGTQTKKSNRNSW